MREPKLKRIRKAWGKGLASLPLIDGRRKRKGDYEIEPLPEGLGVEFDVTPQDEAELARALQDDKLARRIRQLQRDKHPYGTVPEIIMVDYLERKGERYKYQAQLFGGWRGGGLVPDFVVSRGGASRAILIQGQYWHNVPGKKEKDASDKVRLLNAYYEGHVISDVVFVWEQKLMGPDRNRVMDNALAGIEEGP